VGGFAGGKVSWQEDEPQIERARLHGDKDEPGHQGGPVLTPNGGKLTGGHLLTGVAPKGRSFAQA
jgi:hypothetical protein